MRFGLSDVQFTHQGESENKRPAYRVYAGQLQVEEGPQFVVAWLSQQRAEVARDRVCQLLANTNHETIFLLDFFTLQYFAVCKKNNKK